MLPFAEDSTRTENAEGLLPWQLARSEEIAELLRPRVGGHTLAGTYSTTDDEDEWTKTEPLSEEPVTASQIQGQRNYT